MLIFYFRLGGEQEGTLDAIWIPVLSQMQNAPL